uniref:Uncharacterized protein n=1 Tax=viral metagenome TaxID=1070528 RepID=A0A6M3JLE9_9ZZZZ
MIKFNSHQCAVCGKSAQEWKLEPVKVKGTVYCWVHDKCAGKLNLELLQQAQEKQPGRRDKPWRNERNRIG